MRIENEVKLDFKDVLIRPKRSTLSTRSNVDISREFHFRHTQVEYHGVPIIAANMDTTGTFEMARALDAFELSTALHKHYAVDELVAFFRALERKSAAFYSMGIGAADEEKFDRVMEAAGSGADSAIRYVCIDVANGYTEGFVRLVAKIRERLSAPRHHGRQRRHRRDDRGADPLGRGHRQGRHRPRLGVHDAQDDRRRLSAALGDHRMRGCRARARGPHLRRRRLRDAGRHREGLRRRRRLRDAGRHVRRPRRMRGRGRRARRPEVPALLRDEQPDRDGEVRGRRRGVPRRRGQGSAGAATAGRSPAPRRRSSAACARPAPTSARDGCASYRSARRSCASRSR